MSKLIINNTPGHYEGSGFEVDVNSQQIVIRSKSEPIDKERFKAAKQSREPQPSSSKDDGNMSLLSSIGKISQSSLFKKKG
jgi:hypothetical protein